MLLKLKPFALVFALLAFALVGAGQGPSTSKRATSPKPKVDPALAAAAKPLVTTGCDSSLWQHVYNPQRLTVVEKCINVTGTIHHEKKEQDGDEHFQVQLDQGFSTLLNDKNNTVQHGCLVIEPICQNAVTQPDAMAACRDFHSDVDIPKKGTRVRVLGPTSGTPKRATAGWKSIP